MNLRERFNRVMCFDTSVNSMKWEFGYWGETLNNWYAQGLPKRNFAHIPSEITTPCASMYATVWHCRNKYRRAKGVHAYPAGIGITGGGLYSPTQSFPRDNDVKNTLDMDDPEIKLDLNLSFYPMFTPEILKEDENILKYRDLDGVTRIFHKETGVLPMAVEWPIKDQNSWEEIKKERLKLDNIRKRLPQNWDELIGKYKSRDYPLVMGGYPHGFFGSLAHLLGYENVFYAYYDNPDFIHDILNTFTDLWIAVYSEVLSDIEIDAVYIWEDISAGKGSMVSPETMKEYMVPYYKKLTSFLRSKGVNNVIVDTDGNCFDIIPLFIEGGVTGMYPFEVDCGIDIIEVRKKFPKLQMMGGIPKGRLALGKESIDRVLDPVEEVLKTGGYIPHVDHLVPPDVSWENFKYYRTRLNYLINKASYGRFGGKKRILTIKPEALKPVKTSVKG